MDALGSLGAFISEQEDGRERKHFGHLSNDFPDLSRYIRSSQTFLVANALSVPLIFFTASLSQKEYLTVPFIR